MVQKYILALFAELNNLSLSFKKIITMVVFRQDYGTTKSPNAGQKFRHKLKSHSHYVGSVKGFAGVIN